MLRHCYATCWAQRVLGREILGARVPTWLARVAGGARKMQRETPLSEDDLAFIKDAPSDPLELTRALIGRKQPRWLMGWRDICRSTDERTVIASVFPRVGYWRYASFEASRYATCWRTASRCFKSLLSVSALTARLYPRARKVAGTHLEFQYIHAEQLPVLAPGINSAAEDLAFITSRVLELTCTSHSMRPWAEDLGHTGKRLSPSTLIVDAQYCVPISTPCSPENTA